MTFTVNDALDAAFRMSYTYPNTVTSPALPSPNTLKLFEIARILENEYNPCQYFRDLLDPKFQDFNYKTTNLHGDRMEAVIQHMEEDWKL